RIPTTSLLGTDMAKVELESNEFIADEVAHMPQVAMAVHKKARQGQKIAKAKLAPHRKDGKTKITLTEGDRKVDWFINLENPDGGAAAIEFGHQQSGSYAPTRPGEFPVGGLHILGTTMFEMRG